MDTSTLKVFAQRLRAYLHQSGASLQHGQALDLVAALAGLRNWPEVNAFSLPLWRRTSMSKSMFST